MKAVILARVSTEEQRIAGNSLPAQIERLKTYCNSRGFEIAEIFSFDESAYKIKRDEFDRALEYLKKNKEKVIVCFDKVDRFSRNVFDKRVAALYEMAMQNKTELHFASDNLVINADISAVEKFHFGINLGLAKYYSDAISDNVKRAYENKISRGEWIGRAPVGYINTKEERGGKNIIPDLKRAHLIAKMFEMYGSGLYSTREIRRQMEELGLKGTEANKPLSPGMIYSTLNNPFYYGVMKIKNKYYSHRYEPIISKELFNKCQETMKGYNKKPFKYASKPYIFRGLVRCTDSTCGCMITGEAHKDAVYYSCTNYKGIHPKRTYIREEELLKPVYEVLDKISLSEKKIKEIVDDLRGLNRDKNEFHEKQLAVLRAEYDRIDNRISKTMDLMADGVIDRDMFDAKVKEYAEKQKEINEKMERYTNANESFCITAGVVLDLARRAKDIFKNSEPEEKRQLLNLLLQNCKLNGKKLEFELKTPFDTVLQASKCPIGLRE